MGNPDHGGINSWALGQFGQELNKYKSKEWQTPKKKKKSSKVEGPKGEETLPEDANEEDLI